MVHFTGIRLRIIKQYPLFSDFVTFLLSLPYRKGTKNTCKIYATVNFFSAVADNITVKTKRKSNLENNNFILCFATSPFC